MHASNFQLQDYLQRIEFPHSVRADLASLRAVMRHQLFSIPFENTEVQAGKVPSLVPDDIVQKLVVQRRGGYCYEVNGLFAMVLHALGVPYYFVAARPMFYPVRRPRTHMAVVATLDSEPWLFDLGFGSHGIRAPMSLQRLDEPVDQDDDAFMLSRTEESEFLLRAKVDDHWHNQYSFSATPVEWVDFSPMNWLNATHPDAVFVQKLLVIRHHEAGRTVLLGNVLKNVVHGATTQRTVGNHEVATLLRDTFGLEGLHTASGH
jgi:N-hydroxyarylamine O-acetyltransferase